MKVAWMLGWLGGRFDDWIIFCLVEWVVRWMVGRWLIILTQTHKTVHHTQRRRRVFDSPL